MQPTITKVDQREGTVTVRMEDEEGKEVEKTFQLTEDVQYLDSTGLVATLDVFQCGDEILFIEMEGKLTEMKKHPKTKKPGHKEKALGSSLSGRGQAVAKTKKPDHKEKALGSSLPGRGHAVAKTKKPGHKEKTPMAKKHGEQKAQR